MACSGSVAMMQLNPIHKEAIKFFLRGEGLTFSGGDKNFVEGGESTGGIFSWWGMRVGNEQIFASGRTTPSPPSPTIPPVGKSL